MVPLLERGEYMYELRNIAENIVRERLEHFSVHPPVHSGPHTFQTGEVQESCRESSAIPGNAEASEVPQPPPDSTHAAIDFSSTPGGSQAIPAFHIPMTQERTLEGLPSQMDFDWSASPIPTPAMAAATAVPPKVTEVNAFVMVSQIAEEAVKNATQQILEPET